MDDHIRLKTPHEQRIDIERELDFLDHQANVARGEYERKLADIERQRKHLLKQFRRISREEAKHHDDV